MDAFHVFVGKDDWIRQMNRWRCSALGLPGVALTEVMAGGKYLPLANYVVDHGLRELIYKGDEKDRPEELMLTLDLPRSVVRADRAKIIAAVVAALASIVVAAIQYLAATRPARSEATSLSEKVVVLSQNLEASRKEVLVATAENQKLSAELARGAPTVTKASPAPAAQVTFKSPKPNAAFKSGEAFTVEGKLAKVEDGVSYWLVDARSPDHREGWPREAPLDIEPDGSFSQVVWDHGAPGTIFVCVMAVDSATHNKIARWKRTGDKNQSWPALQLKKGGFKELGCTPVVLR